ncbi:AAR043Cp [Eremothecium gossypii ATCC 10895]|uniref:Mannosyltransferase n=1 Tax=Eremothecium gossypii (strain ATCC 10895 / CBS 109.51 / FGSC 9923 / NRRL Y-1056) TaxID=284811 RepID=Q75EN6_EREGS|nr:AAR043Cp [Eremothecium gossypii ATCC 10895]AAS50408.1 AAR043Cp [Eremothecium gossypii ATCC 10895]
MILLLDGAELILLAVLTHLAYSPYTKVEESFTIQAVHDILKYGISGISEYDHQAFPGAVPRTFVGALIIAGILKPLSWLFGLQGGNEVSSITGIAMQKWARAIVGCLNVLALFRMKRVVERKLTANDEPKKRNPLRHTGYWFVVFLSAQFHLMFYASRPLPNFVVCLPLAVTALSLAIEERYCFSIGLLSFTAVVFRLELGAMCIGLALAALVARKVSVMEIIRFGIIGSGVGLGLSATIDSYFWGRSCVPEMDAFVFNVIGGQSAKWGTEPLLAYFTRYLPRLFFPPMVTVFCIAGVRIASTPFRIVFAASLIHIMLLSLQPHKEWRFIIYSVPAITLLGSMGAAYLFSLANWRQANGFSMRILILISPLLMLMHSVLMSYISSMNYPGGYALSAFNKYVLDNNISNATVHLDVFTCMTGATLFGQLPDSYGIIYDKTEGDELLDAWSSFDYVITTDPNSSLPPVTGYKWERIQTTEAFDRFDLKTIPEIINSEVAKGFPILKDAILSADLQPVKAAFTDVIRCRDSVYTYKRVEN